MKVFCKFLGRKWITKIHKMVWFWREITKMACVEFIGNNSWLHVPLQEACTFGMIKNPCYIRTNKVVSKLRTALKNCSQSVKVFCKFLWGNRLVELLKLVWFWREKHMAAWSVTLHCTCNCINYLSKKLALLRWFKILVTSGPSCSGETDLLKWSIKWLGSIRRIRQSKK